jgi:hypothetical protein
MTTEPDPADIARRALDRTAPDPRPDLLADVEARVAAAWDGEVPTTIRVGSSATERSSRPLLVAAAAVVLLVAGSCVWLLARDDGGAVVSTPTVPETPAPTTTATTSTSEPSFTTTTDPSTTLAPIATVATLPTAPVDRVCTTPVAPPSLVDGSPTGERSTFDGYVEWTGSGSNSVRQNLSSTEDPTSLMAGSLTAGRTALAWVIPVGDPPLGRISITVVRAGVLEGEEPCALMYSVGPGLMDQEVRDLAADWVAFWDDGTPVPSSTFAGITLPTDVVAQRYIDEAPFVAAEVLGPDGRLVGTVDQSLVQAAAAGPTLADGRRLELADRSPVDRCTNQRLEIVDGDQRSPVHPDLLEVESVVATPSGIIVATRDVCPDGARWGDPGTRWEMVMYDPNVTEGPDVVTLASREPDLSVDYVMFQTDDVVYAVGDVEVASIDPEARFVGVREAYSTEEWRFHVWSLSDPGQPLELPSDCPAGDSTIVAPPRFVGDGVAVVRFCAFDGRDGLVDEGAPLFVEHVDLSGPRPALLSSTRLPEGLVPSYSMALQASAYLDGSGLWMLINGNDVEQPTTTYVVHDGTVVDVSRRGYSGLAFLVEDLIT